MVEMDSDFKFLEEYFNDKREVSEDGIFLSSHYLPNDKHLQFYRDMSEVVSIEDAWEALKIRRQKILEGGEEDMKLYDNSWIQEEDTDSWKVIIEREGNV